MLKRLRSEGLALLYISHRMHEIAELADDCTVFRNGRNVATYKAGTKTDNEVVELMISANTATFSRRKQPPVPQAKPPFLECRNLSWTERLTDIFAIGQGRRGGRPGGLDGHGPAGLLLALFGVLAGCSGEVLIDGKPTSISSPSVAKSARSAWR